MARAGLGSDWKCVLANDFDRIKVKCYSDNWGGDDLIYGDVRQVSPNAVPDNLDLAWASTPCQNFSSAGLGEGLLGAASSVFTAWWEIIHKKFVAGSHPKIVVLENVRGLLRSRNGQDFGTVAESFVGSGYRFGVVVIDAVHFLPQSRPRIFIVAIRSDVQVSDDLQLSRPIKIWHPDDLVGAVAKLSPEVRKHYIWWRLPTPPTMRLTIFDILDGEGPTWHTHEQTQKLIGAMSPINKSKIESVAGAGSLTVGTLFRRMRPFDGRMKSFTEIRLDGIAGCLRASDGGSSRQMLIFIEGKSIKTRHMTARETARLMGLPDSYLLPSAKTHAAKVVGDGVAIPVVRFLADALISPLARTGEAKGLTVDGNI